MGQPTDSADERSRKCIFEVVFQERLLVLVTDRHREPHSTHVSKADLAKTPAFGATWQAPALLIERISTRASPSRSDPLNLGVRSGLAPDSRGTFLDSRASEVF